MDARKSTKLAEEVRIFYRVLCKRSSIGRAPKNILSPFCPEMECPDRITSHFKRVVVGSSPAVCTFQHEAFMTTSEFDERQKAIKEIVDGVLKNYGMQLLLSTIISELTEIIEEDNEDYLKQLKSDLEVALENYQNRYESEEE